MNLLYSSARSLRCMVALLLLISSLSAAAQLNEAINVEGKYVPEVIRSERINTFPKQLNLSLSTNPLNYEGEGVAAAFNPAMLPLPATGWRADRTIDHHRGYLELGAGSWLNSTLSAGYRFVDNSSTLFGIRLQHNSASLYQPKLSEATEDMKQWRYDESVGLYASHVFRGKGRLDAAIDYHVGVFDYYGWFNPNASAGEKLSAPTQTLNDFSARVDWRSSLRPDASFQYYASARVRHFAFRSLPLPALWNMGSAKGNRETDIEITAGGRMPWDNGSSIGIDGVLNVLVYGGADNVFYRPGSPGETGWSLSRPNNYAVGTLTPYYRFCRGLLDIKLGADIDVAIRAGQPGNRYSLFHFAPEVNFALQTGQVGIFLNATGGTTLNTLAALHQQDYYMMPALTSTRPTYTPLDASFGVNLGPFAGFSLGLQATYRTSRNIRLGGWYAPWTDYGSSPLPQLGIIPDSHYQALYSLDSEGINIHGYSVGGKLTYKPSRLISLLAAGNYQPQKGEQGFFNGYDRPRVTACFKATVSPVSPLHISASYDYRGVRNIYTRIKESSPSASINGKGSAELISMRLPDLSLLNLAASWDFSPDFAVWVQADNILNRKTDILPIQPASGVIIVAGVKLLF
ncbi:MAG: hypothetical protein K2J82_00210 [Muribaculaceae bacterium]|nr:hypothetical protein [Muribaculaceae bacterium]MDE6753015.1 hypothetical protein [Muribaculaceae bacterium]